MKLTICSIHQEWALIQDHFSQASSLSPDTECEPLDYFSKPGENPAVSCGESRGSLISARFNFPISVHFHVELMGI